MTFADPLSNVRELGLGPGMRVADIGAGSGFYAFAAAREVGDGGRVYAIDVQQDLLTKLKNEGARQRLRNIEVVWGNAEEKGGTKLRDMAVDAVILSNVLFQVPHRAGLAAEAKRILKPGGKVLVIDWSGSYGGLGPKQSEVISKTDAQILLEKGGLVFQRDFPAGAQHWGIICVKPGNPHA